MFESRQDPITFQTRPFGIDVETVAEHLSWLDDRLAWYTAELESPNADEQIREHAERLLPFVQAERDFIADYEPEDIVELARSIHDRGMELEGEGLDRQTMITQLHGELPEGRAMRRLLRNHTDWGLILDGVITANEVREELGPDHSTQSSD